MPSSESKPASPSAEASQPPAATPSLPADAPNSSTSTVIKEAPAGELAESSSQTATPVIPSSTAPPVIDMTADDPNSFGDSDSDSDETSVPAPATKTRSNSTYTLENVCQAMDGRLAEMPFYYATLHWGTNVPAAQASLKSAEASRPVMENKLFSEQCARANAKTWAQLFSADRDAAHKEIQLIKSREASLNVQISEMNAVIKIFEIQAFKKSHENLHKILCQADPKETTLTSKLRERNRDLLRRVKRLEKANSALSSRLRLEDMDPEALALMVEGFELDKNDWKTLAPDSQTHHALKAVYKIGLEDGRDHDTLADDIARAKVWFAEIRAEKQRKAEEAAAAGLPAPPPLTVSVRRPSTQVTQDSGVSTSSSPAPSTPQPAVATPTPPQSRSLSITRTGPPVVVGDAGSSTNSKLPSAEPAGSSRSSTVPPAYSPPASTLPVPPVPAGKKGKGKAKRRRIDSDDEDVDFGGDDSGEDALEEGQKSHPSSKSSSKSSSSKPSSSKSSSSKSSVPAPGQHNAGSAPTKVDVTVSDAESMSSPRLTPKRKAAMIGPVFIQVKKSRSKKTGAKSKSGRSSSDESVISVSSEPESESSSDQDSSASEGFEADEDEESELSKLCPKSQCLEDLPDDTLDSKAKSASTTKAGSKPSPKSKKKGFAQVDWEEETVRENQEGDVFEEEIQVVAKDFSVLQEDKYPKLVTLAQRVSILLTPYVAPEFTTVSAQKYWVKLERTFLPSPVPPDAEIKCTTVGIEAFCKFMDPNHAMDLWPEHACLFDTTDFQLDSHISQRADYPERLCGVWRRLRGYGNEKQAVMSFAIYECNHRVSPEAVKRFLSRMAARLSTIKNADERHKFKVTLECLKKVWFTYNKERADRADNLWTFLPGRMWPWCVGPDATLPIETLLDPTPLFYTIENLTWVPGSADWCAEAALVDNSPVCRSTVLHSS
ncbi:hypothetical protein PHMEG_00016053 [Phytophthora megakarya]|uniref:Uncharacterized protein n=1 Tax=Phytophthora megakarya TaxID=4795 RepID=A0A225W081_9STRA|nr:hypothetical protein PHMEG_00016053 [Phytophthora megakarya]